MADTSSLTGERLHATLSTEHIVAAGTGHQVDYVRDGWTVGDLRALLETLPGTFDSHPVLISSAGGEAAALRTASMQPYIRPNGVQRTTLTLHPTK